MSDPLTRAERNRRYRTTHADAIRARGRRRCATPEYKQRYATAEYRVKNASRMLRQRRALAIAQMREELASVA